MPLPFMQQYRAGDFLRAQPHYLPSLIVLAYNECPCDDAPLFAPQRRYSDFALYALYFYLMLAPAMR